MSVSGGILDVCLASGKVTLLEYQERREHIQKTHLARQRVRSHLRGQACGLQECVEKISIFLKFPFSPYFNSVLPSVRDAKRG